MIADSLIAILQCPDCGGPIAREPPRDLACRSCGRHYPVTGSGILRLMPSHPPPLPDAYNDPDYRRMSARFDDSSAYFTGGNLAFKLIHESAHKTIAAWRARNAGAGWVCDIGCGQGYHYRFWPDPKRVIGIDIRLESLEKVRAAFPDAILIQANSCALPLKTGAISSATSIYAFEHIYHLREAIAEAARVLEPGGKLYMGLPGEGGLAWTLGRKLTSERTMSRRYNLDYRKYIALEHCNTAASVIAALGERFKVLRRRLFTLPFLPAIGLNLTVALELEKPR
jgi:SAM-dependent methyltransferase/uncharacterized protein YbaR (Trm112 family)